MLKKFQKHKNIILMMAVWISLFWANFSLASDKNNPIANDIKRPLPSFNISFFIVYISKYILFYMSMIGFVGFCISIILYIVDFFKNRKNKMLENNQNSLEESQKTPMEVVVNKKKKSKKFWLLIISICMSVFPLAGYVFINWAFSCFGCGGEL